MRLRRSSNGSANTYRDVHLQDRARVYASMVRGDLVDTGFLGLGLSGNLVPGEMRGALDIHNEYQRYHEVLLSSMDPGQRDEAQKRISIMMYTIDLPTSVKAALLRDPNADVNNLLDAAPEGRQFSNDPGITGVVSNLGVPLLYYLAVAKGAGGTANAVRLPAGVTFPEIAAARSAGFLTTRGAIGAGAIKTVSTGVTVAAKLQKAGLVAGLSDLPLSVAADAVGRTMGEEGLVDWFDKVNRTAVISDKPSVQLVTSFTVNPFAALGAAKRGVVRLAHGAGDLTVGRLVGNRLATYYDHSTLVADQVRRMYRLGSIDEAERFIDEQLGGKGAAFDQVVGLATQTAIQRLPEAERAALAALPAVDRLETALRAHGPEIMRLLEKDPELLAKRWYEEFWLDRDMPGPVDPGVAALITRDYANAVAKTYEARQRIGAGIGPGRLRPSAWRRGGARLLRGRDRRRGQRPGQGHGRPAGPRPPAPGPRPLPAGAHPARGRVRSAQRDRDDARARVQRLQRARPTEPRASRLRDGIRVPPAECDPRRLRAGTRDQRRHGQGDLRIQGRRVRRPHPGVPRREARA